VDLFKIFAQAGGQAIAQSGQGIEVLDKDPFIGQQRDDRVLQKVFKIKKRTGQGGDDAIHWDPSHSQFTQYLGSVEDIFLHREIIFPGYVPFQEPVKPGVFLEAHQNGVGAFPEAAPNSRIMRAEAKGTYLNIALTQDLESGRMAPTWRKLRQYSFRKVK
jgi:hypothetical protein